MLETDGDDLPVANKSVNYRIIASSRVHSCISQYLYPSFLSYKEFDLTFGNLSQYKVHKIIGFGKYSTVFLATNGKKKVAIKVFKDVKEVTIKREVFILKACKKLSNVIQIIDVVQDPRYKSISIVMEYCKSAFLPVLESLSLDDFRIYLYQLINGLFNLHSHGIIHRDIKPENVLFDKKTKQLRIGDLGLAEIYYPFKQYTTGIGTLRWMAPELIFDYKFYDYAVDMWAVGIIMFITSIDYKKDKVFESLGQMAVAISEMLTPSQILQFTEKYGIFMPNSLLNAMPQVNFNMWPVYIEHMKPKFNNEKFIDLMRKLLVAEPQRRLSAMEALEHPFFDEVPAEFKSKSGFKKASSSIKKKGESIKDKIKPRKLTD